MLRLKNIVKNYTMGDTTVQALKKINIEFRKNEFVSILGPSGCGKTTLLNIIGGLDQYTSGNLYINGRSTKKFKDRDWDHYRNHSVGFVFQNYNLIPHQTVLSNVELALTLSGISKSERRRRAVDVLKKVGLGDQLHKKPNQMSGGQMQRVAIARALINDPEILLADEPTGALDSETSVQIMEILKEISSERLIIMVTHNPELAEQYSSRIVKLLDGNIIDDSNPYYNEEFSLDNGKQKKRKRNRKNSMSFFTALSLSFNNLLTKKGRTFMTAFAGSIGIIGIALILSLSHGVQNYISKVEEDTLSSYPITIEDQTVDVTSLMSTMMGMADSEHTEHALDKVYSRNIVGDMLNTMFAKIETNNLEEFKKFIESDSSGLSPYLNGIQYGYDIDLNIYKSDYSDGVKQVNPNTFMDDIGMSNAMSDSMMSSYTNQNVWVEMMDNRELLESQYDLLAGSWPESYDEVVIIVDENNEISDYTLYSLGLKDIEEISDAMEDAMKGKDIEIDSQETSYTYDELMELKFKVVLSADFYEKNSEGIWIDKSDNEVFMKKILDKAPEIKIVGIIRPNDETVSSAINGAIGYTSDLTEYVIDRTNESEIVKQQKSNAETDIFTGKPFSDSENSDSAQFDMSSLSPEEQQYIASLSQEELQSFMENYTPSSDSTYEENLSTLGVVDLDNPSSINMYATDFEAKEAITDIISEYNKEKTDAGEEEYVISYTDVVGVMMSSVTSIVNIISYILIAFVAISLVVSSIMIGIITYISVLERTKEIGILRSIGASKKDISRVFNAETLIVGFIAGAVGILITLGLLIPINLIIENLTGISSIASLPWAGGIILIAISMILTVIAGLIPSRVASRKDPVEALRTE